MPRTRRTSIPDRVDNNIDDRYLPDVIIGYSWRKVTGDYNNNIILYDGVRTETMTRTTIGQQNYRKSTCYSIRMMYPNPTINAVCTVYHLQQLKYNTIYVIHIYILNNQSFRLTPVACRRHAAALRSRRFTSDLGPH